MVKMNNCQELIMNGAMMIECAAHPAEGAETRNKTTDEKKRIMVVDDEVHFTRLLKATLETGFSYQVQIENNSWSAVEAARRFRPELVLMDVMMPGIDGGTLAAQFKADAQLRQVPIVFMTAAVRREEVKVHHGRIGGLPFLAKPVDLLELVGCIQQNLGSQGNEAAACS